MHTNLNSSVVTLSEVCKSFGQTLAVNRVSFDIQPGEIFGLLGPNGAGKTSIIRLILGILKPDTGQISVFGGNLDSSRLERIGYMPEERGLYQDLRLDRVLNYLASLKGLGKREATQSMVSYLDRLGLLDNRKMKVKELSKGMQQKAQVIATLIHRPELVFLDEPFSALDPINTRVIKDLICQQKQEGMSIVLSTHQLNHAEELCDRILLIDHGRQVLYGRLADIMHEFSDQSVLIRTKYPLPVIPGVVSKQITNHTYRLELPPGYTPQQVLEFLVSREYLVDKFEIARPTLEEIFLRTVQGGQAPS